MLRRSYLLLVLGLAAQAAGLTPRVVRADVAYGVTLFGNELISVDTTTGEGTLVGSLGPSVQPFGLASVGGKLYTFDSTAGVVRQVDPTTGGTLATIDVGIGPVLGQGGLAFQNASVGFLTSALDPNPPNNPANNLYRFDISSGTSMLVAHTAVTLSGLAFNPAGVLYGLGKLDGNLYTVDITNGATTLVGNTGVAVGSPTGGLAFGPGGTLYATLDDKLYTLDASSGMATAVGDADTSFDTGFSSISGLAVAAVPEPSVVVLFGVGGVVVLASRWVGRCRVTPRPA